MQSHLICYQFNSCLRIFYKGQKVFLHIFQRNANSASGKCRLLTIHLNGDVQALRGHVRIPHPNSANVNHPMKRLILLATTAIAMSTSAFAQTWATATSTNQSNGRVIIFRYINELDPNLNRTSQPDRIILAWKYQSESGMPTSTERQRMDLMEDSVAPIVEKDGFATLALVSTGENLREWTYYAKSEAEFMVRLNNALSKQTAFPIEIHTAADPKWTMYEKFKSGVRK